MFSYRRMVSPAASSSGAQRLSTALRGLVVCGLVALGLVFGSACVAATSQDGVDSSSPAPKNARLAHVYGLTSDVSMFVVRPDPAHEGYHCWWMLQEHELRGNETHGNLLNNAFLGKQPLTTEAIPLSGPVASVAGNLQLQQESAEGVMRAFVLGTAVMTWNLASLMHVGTAYTSKGGFGVGVFLVGAHFSSTLAIAAGINAENAAANRRAQRCMEAQGIALAEGAAAESVAKDVPVALSRGQQGDAYMLLRAVVATRNQITNFSPHDGRRTVYRREGHPLNDRIVEVPVPEFGSTCPALLTGAEVQALEEILRCGLGHP